MQDDFFTAGTDTTAILIEWALAELINHPKVLKKVREEVDRVVGNKRLLVESDGPNLPVSMVIRKCVEKCKFGKYVIPENTMLFVNVRAIGRDPKYWENPLNFQPERFLSQPHSGGDGTSALDVRGQHFELLPFGTGRRICPGVNLVMQMMHALLGAMVQCFDWKVIGPHQKKMNGNDLILEMDERPGMTTPRAHDLVCIPVARLNLLDVLDP
ncbi:licodione synthase-like [Pyrus x bretschneideri]|uniref:licodione synthase-like n=1 Tax=Pyrus x bretschneideri TaxID=225117 RepID=UPI00202F2E8D|nr:licodione synthase-like [Pyrus x bretschneideri]